MNLTDVMSALLAPNILRPGTSRWLVLTYRILGPGSVFAGAAIFCLTLATMFFPTEEALQLLYATILASMVVAARQSPVLIFLGTLLFTMWTLVPDDSGITIWPPLLTGLLVAVAFARVHGWPLALSLLVSALSASIVLNRYLYQDFAQLAMTLTVVLAVALTVTGVLVWQRSRVQGRQLAEVRQDVEVERGQRRNLEERGRIAREMHDVVAHHMSMVAVKASTAEYRLHDLTEDAKEEFRAIAETSRESLTEMRRILAVFRTEEKPELAPQPGIERLDALCRSARDAGLEVTVTVAAQLPELPDAVSLTAYRIVQEALSNVVRHAPGAAATVELYTEAEWLAIVVMNNAPTGTFDPSSSEYAEAQEPTREIPAPAATVASATADTTPMDTLIATPPAAPEDGGLGLAGMRERVELLHGELFAQPLGGSGFLVKARLPLELVEDG